jgi:hypothetical protein
VFFILCVLLGAHVGQIPMSSSALYVIGCCVVPRFGLWPRYNPRPVYSALLALRASCTAWLRCFHEDEDANWFYCSSLTRHWVTKRDWVSIAHMAERWLAPVRGGLHDALYDVHEGYIESTRDEFAMTIWSSEWAKTESRLADLAMCTFVGNQDYGERYHLDDLGDAVALVCQLAHVLTIGLDNEFPEDVFKPLYTLPAMDLARANVEALRILLSSKLTNG